MAFDVSIDLYWEEIYSHMGVITIYKNIETF